MCGGGGAVNINANSKSSDQPAHPRSLIRAVAVRRQHILTLRTLQAQNVSSD